MRLFGVLLVFAGCFFSNSLLAATYEVSVMADEENSEIHRKVCNTAQDPCLLSVPVNSKQNIVNISARLFKGQPVVIFWDGGEELAVTPNGKTELIMEEADYDETDKSFKKVITLYRPHLLSEEDEIDTGFYKPALRVSSEMVTQMGIIIRFSTQ